MGYKGDLLTLCKKIIKNTQGTPFMRQHDKTERCGWHFSW